METKKNENKVNVHQLFWYFLIFSILGIFIETIYCFATTGVLESRKGLIWGPFCPVYGVSAAVLIFFLAPYKDKKILPLFFYGFIAGSVAEYLLSYGLEMIYGIRFWDYSYTGQDINGRICLQYSIYWGILSVVLVKFIKPILDKGISKIKPSIRNKIEIGMFIFFIIDCIFTVWGIQTYENRVLKEKQEEPNSPNIFIQLKYNIEENYFTNERMSKTFPNLRIKDENGNEVWIRTLIP